MSTQAKLLFSVISLKLILEKIIASSPRGQWVKYYLKISGQNVMSVV